MTTDTRELELPTIDGSNVSEIADRMLGWLRTFWTKLYRDKSFAKYLQGSRALKYAQLYLDVLEGIRLMDHSTAPVFHRERWYPIIVRQNETNMSDASVLRLGDDAVLSSEVVAPYDSKLRLGEHTSLEEFVTYQLPDKVVDVMACIVDNIADPGIVLKNGSDFRIKDSSIVIRKTHDPFGADTPFAVFDVPETPESPGTKEAVLWACDTLVDRDYMHDHVGYAVGLEGESGEAYARIVRAVWDATTDGLSMEHLRQILAALCGIPCVLTDGETVQALYQVDGYRQVITDRNVYTLGESAELRDAVRAGNKLSKGDFLDNSVRIYPFVMYTDRMEGYTEFSEEQFRRDVASIEIPSALIRSDVSGGFYVGWDEKPVIYSGNDSNGNARYRFDLGMSADDEDRYWSDVWSKYEKLGKPMRSCFDDLVGGSMSEGDICGTVVPIRFFLRNLVGANTLIVFVDTDRIRTDAPLYDPNFFQVLRRLMPSYVRMYFIEHGSVIDDEYSDDLDTATDTARIYASLDEIEDEYGLDTADDRIVSKKWTKKCRGRDDSDDYD